MDEHRAYNRAAWDGYVERGNDWTVPVSPEVIAAARRGEWQLGLIENWLTPRDWFPEPLRGADILCLASGGGQQGPILAAAGANVTVFDNSPAQLAQDRLVAAREGLALCTVEGDMRDLSALADESYRPDLSSHLQLLCGRGAARLARVLSRVATGRRAAGGVDQPRCLCL